LVTVEAARTAKFCADPRDGTRDTSGSPPGPEGRLEAATWTPVAALPARREEKEPEASSAPAPRKGRRTWHFMKSPVGRRGSYLLEGEEEECKRGEAVA
jgi:hypothetical protein